MSNRSAVERKMVGGFSSQRLELLTFEDVSVPLIFGECCLTSLVDRVTGIRPDCIGIVVDDRVLDLHGRTLEAVLTPYFKVVWLVVPRGEASKSLGVLEGLIAKALRSGLTRSSVILTFGGGVVGNVGGLLAAMLFRGIRLVQVPTTIMAAFDSVISLKQAVNVAGAKNIFGTYYAPSLVLVDTQFLRTLPERESRSGLCEAIKNALVIHPGTIERLASLLAPAMQGDSQALSEICAMSIAAKCEVMVRDKRESCHALVLEYGHTVGHALELAHSADSEQRISHGESVALGMLVAANVSRQLGYLEPNAVQKHEYLLSIIRAPTRLPPAVDPNDVIAGIRLDNKRGYLAAPSNNVLMVLLRDLGIPLRSGDLPLIAVPDKILEEEIWKLSDFKG